MVVEFNFRLPYRRHIRIDTGKGIVYEGEVMNSVEQRGGGAFFDESVHYDVTVSIERIYLDSRFTGEQVAMFRDAMQALHPDVIVLQEAS
jgi:hypothetical protein